MTYNKKNAAVCSDNADKAAQHSVLEEVREELKRLAEEDYQRFNQKLLPGTENILGVRLPKLRQIAKRLAKQDWKAFADERPTQSYEETMIWGMMLGYVKTDFHTLEGCLRDFIPAIDNWAVCDSCCNTLKVFRENPQEGWSFLEPYGASENEFEARFAMVMYLNHYVNETYVEQVLKTAREMKAQGYYAKMASAWLISECCTDFAPQVFELLESGSLDDFVHNKTISKICESYRIPKETKAAAKALRRKK